VTYASRLTREDGAISWASPALAIHNQVRGLHPWPHAFTSLGGARVIIHRTALTAAPLSVPDMAETGEVLAVAPEGIVVLAGDRNPVTLLQVQAEGRRMVTAREFAAGARLRAGARFGV